MLDFLAHFCMYVRMSPSWPFGLLLSDKAFLPDTQNAPLVAEKITIEETNSYKSTPYVFVSSRLLNLHLFMQELDKNYKFCTLSLLETVIPISSMLLVACQRSSPFKITVDVKFNLFIYFINLLYN